MIVRAGKGRQGKKRYNVTNLEGNGNNSARALIDLEKKRPDLHAQVIAKEISPHGAMVEAAEDISGKFPEKAPQGRRPPEQPA